MGSWKFGHLCSVSLRFVGKIVSQASHLKIIPHTFLWEDFDCLLLNFFLHLSHVSGSLFLPLQERMWLVYLLLDSVPDPKFLSQSGQNFSSCKSRCCLKMYQFLVVKVHFPQFNFATGFELLVDALKLSVTTLVGTFSGKVWLSRESSGCLSSESEKYWLQWN